MRWDEIAVGGCCGCCWLRSFLSFSCMLCPSLRSSFFFSISFLFNKKGFGGVRYRDELNEWIGLEWYE